MISRGATASRACWRLDLGVQLTYVIGCSPPCHGGEPRSEASVSERGGVRIASVTESLPPDVNGVASTTVRVAEHRMGHRVADSGRIAFRLHGVAAAPTAAPRLPRSGAVRERPGTA